MHFEHGGTDLIGLAFWDHPPDGGWEHYGHRGQGYRHGRMLVSFRTHPYRLGAGVTKDCKRSVSLLNQRELNLYCEARGGEHTLA